SALSSATDVRHDASVARQRYTPPPHGSPPDSVSSVTRPRNRARRPAASTGSTERGAEARVPRPAPMERAARTQQPRPAPAPDPRWDRAAVALLALNPAVMVGVAIVRHPTPLYSVETDLLGEYILAAQSLRAGVIDVAHYGSKGFGYPLLLAAA